MPRKAKSRRTPPPTGSGGYQPAVAATGQPYGAAGDQLAAQAALPLPLGTPPQPGGAPPGAPMGAGAGAPPDPGGGGAPGAMGAPPGPDPITAAASMAPPSPTDFLSAPSTRPGESLLAGADQPGGGVAAAAIRPADASLAQLAQSIADTTGDPVAAQIAASATGLGT